MKCLGIDYGEKRIGLSYGDELGIAVPIPAATQETLEERLAYIAKVAQERRIDRFVLGLPYNMNGSESFMARETRTFAERLTQLVPLPLYFVDERLTSQQAFEGMKQMKKKPKSIEARKKERQSGRLDSNAAALILQDYLDLHVPPPLL